MKTTLTGQRSQCAACGRLFTTTANFDRHRTGPYTARRCLSATELVAKGYSPNAAGFWRVPFDTGSVFAAERHAAG